MVGKIARYSALILLGFLLQSCASPKHSQEVQKGKMYFEQGNFKLAFHQLLPIAAAGNAQAQYAVGYMYYYGYGTSEDQESGLFWMQKSAEQHYDPAIKALNIINSPDVQPQRVSPPPVVPVRPMPPVTQKIPPKSDRDAVIQALPPRTAPVSLKQDPTPKIEAPQKKLVRADGYGLQLFGAYELEHVKKEQINLGVQSSSVIWHAENKGKDWYVLIYKHFSTVADAKKEMKQLPQNLVALGPWVRALDNLG
jgi:TPR repeat protein